MWITQKTDHSQDSEFLTSQGKSIPIIAMTADAFREDVVRLLRRERTGIWRSQLTRRCCTAHLWIPSGDISTPAVH